MKTLRLLIILLALTAMVWIKPTLCDAQGTWQTRLAQGVATFVSNTQKFCIEKGKVECELIEIEENPPLLLEGQVIDYIDVRQRGVVYFYLVVAEKENMDPDIYLFDSQGKLLVNSKEVGPFDVVVHVPEYTQKVIERIKMHKGSGHIGLAVLAPVGSN
jgi:hypothetical protein